MFGDKSEGFSSAVGDSRQLGDLASIFSSSEKLALLEAGHSVSSIYRQTRPLDERLRRNLAEIRALQSEILTGLAEQDVAVDEATTHLPAATAARKQATQIERQLANTILPSDDD